MNLQLSFPYTHSMSPSSPYGWSQFFIKLTHDLFYYDCINYCSLLRQIIYCDYMYFSYELITSLFWHFLSFLIIYIILNFQNFTKCQDILWRKRWQPTPVLLPGKSHGQRSLVGCSPWGCEESDTTDTTERLPFHFSLSCIGEGNGNPLQCSCLENPRDGGAWWAAIYEITQSWTRLKRLSSNSSRTYYCLHRCIG